MMNFPANPVEGQRFTPAAGKPNYTFDGLKWTTAPARESTLAPPSTTMPSMNGAVLPGVSVSYARSDHIHPTDATRASVNNPSFSGTLTANLIDADDTTAATLNVTGDSTVGALNATTSLFGSISASLDLIVSGAATFGTLNAAYVMLPIANAFIEMGSLSQAGTPYLDFHSSGNDIDYDARIIATGGSGTAARGDLSLSCSSVIGPTPPGGDNSTRAATTAWARQNIVVGSFLPTTGGTINGYLTVAGDLYSYRSGGGTGVLYLGTGDRYIYWDGANYTMGSAPLVAGNGRLWGSNDFNAQPLTNERLVYAGDNYIWSSEPAISEPWNGCVMTGSTGYAISGSPGPYGHYNRLRYWQGYTTGWFTIGYA